MKYKITDAVPRQKYYLLDVEKEDGKPLAVMAFIGDKAWNPKELEIGNTIEGDLRDNDKKDFPPILNKPRPKYTEKTFGPKPMTDQEIRSKALHSASSLAPIIPDLTSDENFESAFISILKKNENYIRTGEWK